MREFAYFSPHQGMANMGPRSIGRSPSDMTAPPVAGDVHRSALLRLAVGMVAAMVTSGGAAARLAANGDPAGGGHLGSPVFETVMSDFALGDRLCCEGGNIAFDDA